MPAPYAIQPVETAAQQQLFLEFPDRLYAALPHYVRPNNQELATVFEPGQNKVFQQGGQLMRWLLLAADGQPVGRIAAFVNPSVQATEKQPVGGFGFFECIDDQTAAHTLLDTARQWLVARGMQAMDGPINFGERDRYWGLLVDGFDRLPVYGMFYHPPYYQRLLEAYGLEVYFRQYTYRVDITAPLHARIQAKFREFGTQPGVRFTHADGRQLDKLAYDFHYVYSRAWGKHSGVSGLTLEQTRKIVEKMKVILDEKIVWFAYAGDEPVAIFIAIPGLNQIFHRTGPNLNWWGKLKFVLERRRWQRRRDKLSYGIVYGVIPAYQGTGIDAALVHACRPTFLEQGYTEIEMSWIGDFNPKMMATCRAVGGTICKTHHTYRQYFDPTHPFERSPIIGREKSR